MTNLMGNSFYVHLWLIVKNDDNACDKTVKHHKKRCQTVLERKEKLRTREDRRPENSEYT